MDGSHDPLSRRSLRAESLSTESLSTESLSSRQRRCREGIGEHEGSCKSVLSSSSRDWRVCAAAEPERDYDSVVTELPSGGIRCRGELSVVAVLLSCRGVVIRCRGVINCNEYEACISLFGHAGTR